MSSEIPSWAIAVAVLFASIIVIFSTLFLVRRRLLKRGVIGVEEKNIGSSQVTLNRSLSTFTSPPESPYTIQSSRTPLDEKKTFFQCSTPTLPTTSNNKDEKAGSSSIEVSVTTTTTTYQTLPPPSSSFFSDKMELDSAEAQALYNAYVNGIPPQKNSNTQNIQQRAAALSTNLTKSIRRRSMANLPTSIVQFFEKNDNSSNNNISLEHISNNENSSSSPSSSSSKFNGPTLQADDAEASYIEIAKNGSTMSLAKDLDDAHSTKIMIEDDDNDAPYFNIPFSPSSPAPLCFSGSASINNEEDNAIAAARKAIQSASRKSRTRSMIIADETAQAMFSMIENATVPTLNHDSRRNSMGGQSTLSNIQNSTAQSTPPRSNPRILESATSSSDRRRHSVMLDHRTSLLSDTNEKAAPDTTATIRKMLQSSWSGNNLKESGSSASLLSDGTSGSFNPPVDHRRPSMPAAFANSQGQQRLSFSSLLASRPTDPPHF